MKNKLENLSVEKIAFVPQGDNKGANVLIFKNKPIEPVDVSISTESVLKKIICEIASKLGLSHDSTGLKEINKSDSGMQKGDNSEMKIDKSKLNEEELAMLEAIEKKAGIKKEPDSGAGSNNKPVGKSQGNEHDDSNHVSENEPDDIYKGLNPAVKAEIEKLKKRADEADEKELAEVAKKYEIIGKKPEELVKTFKSLRAAGNGAYEEMISALDASVALVEKSGVFSEIGKNGGNTNATETKIEKYAQELMTKDPNLNRYQALDKAYQLHPELQEEE